MVPCEPNHYKGENNELLELYRVIFDNVCDGLFLLDIEDDNTFKYTIVNKKYQNLTGISQEEFEGQIPSELFEEETANFLTRMFIKCCEIGDCVEYEEIFDLPGDVRTYLTVIYPVLEKGQPVKIVGSSRDITERKQMEKSLYDDLTGFCTRSHMEKEMKRLDTFRQLPISLMMAELNGLKLINEIYGFDLGDEALKKVAEILEKSCRKEDIISRWGDDDFALLLLQAAGQETRNVCRRITDNLIECYVGSVPVTLSLGIGVKASVDMDIKETLLDAREDMYKNKEVKDREVKDAILDSALKTLEAKSHEDSGHRDRMKKTATKLGEDFGLSQAELSRLETLVDFHDIGEVMIPGEILTREGTLNDEDWQQIKEHPIKSQKIVLASKIEEYVEVADEIVAHHEWWNGKGYPQGLKGENIPLLARILAVADAYEAMSSGRPYKDKMSKEEIIEEFKSCAGAQFDPRLVDLFLTSLE